jgi:hypothetical protein
VQENATVNDHMIQCLTSTNRPKGIDTADATSKDHVWGNNANDVEWLIDRHINIESARIDGQHIASSRKGVHSTVHRPSHRPQAPVIGLIPTEMEVVQAKDLLVDLKPGVRHVVACHMNRTVFLVGGTTGPLVVLGSPGGPAGGVDELSLLNPGSVL